MFKTHLTQWQSIRFVGMLIGVMLATHPVRSAPMLDRATFPATGYHETILHIDQPGRYSIQAQSPQGTGIEFVERMAGPRFSAGRAGQQDGRIDALLNTGDYKLRLSSAPQGTGELVVTVKPFQEAQPVNTPEELPIVESLQSHNGELGDYQQRSFWISLKDRQVFRLEALGRSLKECRLWMDGDWLVDVTPEISMVEPVAGQPMTYVEFYHDLNAGLYQLTCYGGEPLAWAKESSESPFYLRRGISDLGVAGQRVFTISPFGRDTYAVSGETTFVELRRPDKKDTALQAANWQKTGSRHASGQRAQINKESRDPWCSVQVGRTQDPKFVTIQGTPGDTVTLNYFTRQAEYGFPKTAGTYWITSQSSAEAGDTIDVTAILSRYWSGSGKMTVEQALTVPLAKQQPIARTINLLGELTVFVEVQDDGTYMVTENQESGAKGRYRLEPLLFTKPKDYRAPEYTLAGADIELQRGFYTLSIQPEAQGILTFTLHEKNTLLPARPATPEELTIQRVARQRLLWPSVTLTVEDQYALTLNARQDVITGLLIRPLPLNLRTPLPVTLLPGEQVPLPVEIKQASILTIESDSSATFEITGYAKPITSGATLSPGQYTLKLKNTSKQAAWFSIKTTPASVTASLKPADIAQRLKNKQTFPVISAAQPIYRNFARTEQQHFTLMVDQPGLYRLETSGRLATRLTVRNRFVTKLASAEQNGIGRNALVQQYLEPGEYQVTVQTLGQSTGHAGLHLRRVPLIEEKGLQVGVLKKIQLAPDEAVRYQFAIQTAGDYRLRTLGLQKTFRWRLEDQDGWPLVTPDQTEPIERHFEPGTYGYFSLPEAVESRRVTVLEQIAPEKPTLEGKGPHPIRLNEPVEHVWREAPNRPPDVFVLDVPDPLRAEIVLSEDLAARLLLAEKEIGAIVGGESAAFDLSPGRYEIRVKSLRENDQLPYSLSVETNYLVTDLRYNIEELPASFTVSTGDERLVELFSFGDVDVKASLWQGKKLIAVSDDMAHDWNFRIAQKLQPGTYHLKIERVGKRNDDDYYYDDTLEDEFLTVGMTKRKSLMLPAAQLPLTVTRQFEPDVVSLPFTTPAEEQLVSISANGGQVNMALFQNDRQIAQGAQALLIPLKPSTAYTLLFWRVDDATSAVTVKADTLQMQPLVMPATLTQIPIPAAAGSPFQVFKLNQAEKQSYMLRSQRPLWFSPALETPLQAVRDVPVVLPQQMGWLVCQTDATESSLTIAPFVLSHETEAVEVGIAPVPFDFTHDVETPLLLDISSSGATIGALATLNETYPPEQINWSAVAIAPSQTLLAIGGKGQYRGRIWAASGESVDGQVRIRRQVFSQMSAQNFGATGRQEGQILPGQAVVFSLAETDEVLDLLLAKGLVGFVWNNGQTEALVAATQENGQYALRANGGSLILLNRGAHPGSYRIDRTPATARAQSDIPQPFDSAHGFEQVFAAAGELALNIAASAKTTFITGDHIQSRLFSADGRVIEITGESSLPPQSAGLLKIRYGAGYVRVWQSTPDMRQQGFIGAFSDTTPLPLQDGLGTLDNAPQRWSFSCAQSVYMIAASDTPGVTALVRQNQVLASTTGSASSGRQIEYFLKPGEYELWTRPLNGLSQQGTLRVSMLTPTDLDAATAISWLIRSGETQVFRFQVTTTSKVGVGVRTESDQLQTALFDREFNQMATGPLILKKLPAGEYLFTVQTLSAETPPVQYRPVIFGHHGSQQGIPPDVLKEYQGQ